MGSSSLNEFSSTFNFTACLDHLASLEVENFDSIPFFSARENGRGEMCMWHISVKKVYFAQSKMTFALQDPFAHRWPPQGPPLQEAEGELRWEDGQKSESREMECGQTGMAQCYQGLGPSMREGLIQPHWDTVLFLHTHAPDTL